MAKVPWTPHSHAMHLSLNGWDEDIANSIYCLVCLFLILTPLVVHRRIWHSFHRYGGLGHGDVTLMIAVIVFLLQCVLTARSLTSGILSQSLGQGDDTKWLHALEHHVVAQTLYSLSCVLIRISAFLTLYPYISSSSWRILRRYNASVPGILMTVLLFLSIEMIAAYTTVWTEHCAAVVWNWERVDHGKLGGGWCIKPDMVQSHESMYVLVMAVTTTLSTFVASWIFSRGQQMSIFATLQGFFVLFSISASVAVLLRLLESQSASGALETNQFSYKVLSSILEPGFSILALASLMFNDDDAASLPQHKVPV